MSAYPPPPRQVWQFVPEPQGGTRAEWVRWWVGFYAATPFYAAERVGKRLGDVGERIVRSSERASVTRGSTPETINTTATSAASTERES